MSTSATGPKEHLNAKLPMVLPAPFVCPICGAKVHLTAIVEWGTDDGEISGVEYECDTEPDIDSDDWPDWHAGHFSRPYCTWLPWEMRMIRWLNEHYRL
jgi:hypothetical protein